LGWGLVGFWVHWQSAALPVRSRSYTSRLQRTRTWHHKTVGCEAKEEDRRAVIGLPQIFNV
jgi:hypothetical protein